MNNELLLLISNTLTATASFFVGRKRQQKKIDELHEENKRLKGKSI